MKLEFIALFIFLVNVTSIKLSDRDEIRINNMAWLFAQFSLTFDPNEINSSVERPSTSTTNDESMVSLYSYFRNNEKEFDNYKKVLDFFDNDHLKTFFPNIDLNELMKIFEERITVHQNNIVIKDETPLSFKKFYLIFEMIRGLIDIEYDNPPSWPKYQTFADIPTNHPLMQLFCNEHFLNNEDEVIKSLNNFKLNNGFQKNSYEVVRSLTLSHDFMQHLIGSKDPKPSSRQIHHMIPSQTLVQFYNYYFQLLFKKSEKMMEYKKFNWIKISQINTEKTFLVDAATLWMKFGGMKPRPVDFFKYNPNGAQENFVKYWYSLPIGLLFYGPHQTIRNDDPSKPDNVIKFNQPNEFELHAASIVGQEYFDKVKELNLNILAFITSYESKIQNEEELNHTALKIYNRILTIHREAPWDNKIIAPFDPDQWIFTGDWSIKILAQQESRRVTFYVDQNYYNFYRLSEFMEDVSSGVRHDELKRRKRHHLYDHLLYRQHLEMTCSLIKFENSRQKDSCNRYLKGSSPSILSVPAYTFCKIFG